MFRKLAPYAGHVALLQSSVLASGATLAWDISKEITTAEGSIIVTMLWDRNLVQVKGIQIFLKIRNEKAAIA